MLVFLSFMNLFYKFFEVLLGLKFSIGEMFDKNGFTYDDPIFCFNLWVEL